MPQEASHGTDSTILMAERSFSVRREMSSGNVTSRRSHWPFTVVANDMDAVQIPHSEKPSMANTGLGSFIS